MPRATRQLVNVLPALEGVWESHEADASGLSLFSCLTALIKLSIRLCPLSFHSELQKFLFFFSLHHS